MAAKDPISTRRWRRLRSSILARDAHQCYICGRPANAVDHKIPRAAGGAVWDPDNLAAVCSDCNGRKAAGSDRVAIAHYRGVKPPKRKRRRRARDTPRRAGESFLESERRGSLSLSASSPPPSRSEIETTGGVLVNRDRLVSGRDPSKAPATFAKPPDLEEEATR